jgi:acyl carrier protein phosphodiesterase
MNYLAHFYLADDTQTSISGALLGDFVKGAAWQQLPADEQVGVLLHRRIDVWTDQWVIDCGLTQIAPGKLRRLVGIALDVYLDHLLANHWHDWHHQSLDTFSQHAYEELAQTSAAFAPTQMITNMTQYDWLCRYQDTRVIKRALERIGERFRRPLPLADLYPHLLKHHSQIQEHFFEVFPQIRALCQQWSEELLAERR